MKKAIKKLCALFLTATLAFSGAACDLSGFLDSLQSEVESALQPGWDTETDKETDTDTESSDTATDSGSSDTATDPDSGSDSDSTSDTDSGSDTDSSSDTDSGSDSDSTSDTDSGSDSDSTSDTDSSSDSDSTGAEEPLAEAMSVHFLELGNEYAGDCTLIDIAETEILIDAGSRRESAPTLKKYIDKYCEDGKLEYVIATHAHQDHIAAFVGNQSGSSYTGILYQYKVGTLIQFSKSKSTSQIYAAYKTAVEYVKGRGTTVHTVLECWNNQNGAQRTYQVGDGITMNFLYQKYYETSGDENNYSVCMLLTQGENNYLFTGDLEKAGEESLVASNNLPKCKLYKGGHHGSKTSSNEVLLAAIQPEIVCVCCCAGTNEYTDNKANQFPTQDFINRVAPYTDKVYVTSAKAGYTMNGNICVSCPDGKNVTVTGSNNSLVLKETAWFKAERTLPSAWMPY